MSTPIKIETKWLVAAICYNFKDASIILETTVLAQQNWDGQQDEVRIQANLDIIEVVLHFIKLFDGMALHGVVEGRSPQHCLCGSKIIYKNQKSKLAQQKQE